MPQVSGEVEYFRERTVSLWSGGEFLGSGFFVDRGLVATCAHVCYEHRSEIVVRWHGMDAAARSVQLSRPQQPTDPTALGFDDTNDDPLASRYDFDRIPLPREYEDRNHGFYPFPDLALVETGSEWDHPWVSLKGERNLREKVMCLSFDPDSPSPDRLEYEALFSVPGSSGGYLRLSGDGIHRGMSGGLVVDLTTSTVVGLVKASRDYEGDRGGYCILTRDLVAFLDRYLKTRSHQVDSQAAPRRPGPDEDLYQIISAQEQMAEHAQYRPDGTTPPPLSVIYVPQHLATTVGNAVPIASVDLDPVRLLRNHRHLLIEGLPGIGKSTFLQHLVLSSSRWWLQESDQPRPEFNAVVVRVDAKKLVGNRPWLTLLQAALTATSYLRRAVPMDLLDRPPRPGVEWLLLIDGLDEVFDPDERRQLVRALSYHLSRYGEFIRMVIASRPLREAEYAELLSAFYRPSEERLGRYVVEPFDDAALYRFVSNWFREQGFVPADVHAQKFLQRVAESRLDDLVRIPLLAMIAAVVYQTSPESTLPIDRAGLYDAFMRSLIHDRRARIDARLEMKRRLSAYGQELEDLADYIFDHTEECLEFLAVRYRRTGNPPTRTDVSEWLAEQRPSAAFAERVVDQTMELLEGTGLFSKDPNGWILRFVHESYAEYFAVGAEARTSFSPENWLAGVQADGLTNEAMFGLARWRRHSQDNDPLPILSALMMAGPTRDFPLLTIFSAVLQDGILLGESTTTRLFNLIFERLRDGLFYESDHDRLEVLVRALRRRGAGAAEMLPVVADLRTSVFLRVAVLRALIVDGGDDGEAAIAQLREQVNLTEPDSLNRVVLLELMATVPKLRPVALSRLSAEVVVPDLAVQLSALRTLLLLDETDSLVRAVLGHYCDPAVEVLDRDAFLRQFSVVTEIAQVSDLPFVFNAAALPSASGRFVALLILRLSRSEPWLARWYALAIVGDRSIDWSLRATCARTLFTDDDGHELGAEMIFAMAVSPVDSWTLRLEALRRLRRGESAVAQEFVARVPLVWIESASAITLRTLATVVGITPPAVAASLIEAWAAARPWRRYLVRLPKSWIPESEGAL